MTKFFQKYIDIFITILIALGVLSFMVVYECSANSYPEYPKLEDNIENIENLIGEYSEYYVVIDKENNNVIHSMSGTEENGVIYLVVPETTNISKINLDFYTGWDEKLATYTCDFKNNTYVVKNKTISILPSDLQFVFIDIDKDDLNRINGSYREDNPKKEKAEINFTTQGKKIILKDLEGKLQPRGAATWHLYQKLPYSLKLEESCDYFGLGKDKKYNLLANATDKTLLKNEIFFDLARNLKLAYTPKIKNIHLFFNDSYKGIYSVSTKVDKGKNRVNLGNGDFLINWVAPNYETKIEYECSFFEDNEIKTPYVDVVWPDKDSITKNDKEKVHDVVQTFIDILENEDDERIKDVIDLESFAKYYWVQEISMNADGFYRSTYCYYKNNDKKLYAGPIWDMEWAIGTRLGGEVADFINPEGWKMRYGGLYERLFHNKYFVEEVNKVYFRYNIESLLNDSYEEYVSKVNEYKDECQLNYLMCQDEIDFYDIIESKNFEDFSKQKTDFYKKRINWITKEMKTTNAS